MNSFIDAFNKFIGRGWNPSPEIYEMGSSLLKYALDNGYEIKTPFEDAICEAINQKLDVGKNVYQHILDVAFQEHIKLNYNYKKAIQQFVTSADDKGYIQYLRAANIMNTALENAFSIISREESKKVLKETLDSDKKHADIVTAIFVRAFYHSFEEKCRDLFFSKEEEWDRKYVGLLERRYPGFSNRRLSQVFVEVDPKWITSGYESGCNHYFNIVAKAFRELDNHCDLIVVIPPIKKGNDDFQWKLYSDLILFAEKHDLHHIDRIYFRHKKIAEVTSNYIHDIDVNKAKFELAAEGFVFKDCFVSRTQKVNGYLLTIVFEKNVRDEREINCPVCRSTIVQGNSYPILNVRSWECENPLCPDRSKYNRGKRFAYVSYRRQIAMEDDRNEIPESALADWHLDCTEIRSIADIFDMACCFYSFADDTIEVDSQSLDLETEYKFRKIRKANNDKEDNLYHLFKNSPYFARYNYLNTGHPVIDLRKETYYLSPINVLYHGDSRVVLHELETESISAAVTSPPYYNAKSYSQWDNIYCYLYDMRNIASEVYRVLKTGGVFLFNIFDYFDNENNIALSAMGNKRMILGAYIIDLFERIGFSVYGNIIWDKGEIQGNRNFNQGNNTPYYQAPLNCWEHVIVFAKGSINIKYKGLHSKIQKIKPYIKYVRGKNVLGHDAPFPEDIPNLLLNYMDNDDWILDPFSGSYTTGIAAYKKNVKSICIEMRKEYIELSKTRFSENNFS